MPLNRFAAGLRSAVALELVVIMLGISLPAAGQQPRGEAGSNASPPTEAVLTETVRQLQQQVEDLRAVVMELRAESRQYRGETEALRSELKTALEQRAAGTPEAEPAVVSSSDSQGMAAVDAAKVEKLEEEYSLLAGKVDDQYQTKIESASKYRVRLSGIVLLNLFETRGQVGSADVAEIAKAPDVLGRSSSFGGSLRQSQIGLELFGPTVAGARTRGEVEFDFAGGFPDTANGVSLGIMRLRTGTIHVDWPRTSIVAGQDGPFFSPLSPTSFATLAEPAMSYAGNLWTWAPQVRVEHRFALSENSSMMVQGGILDSLSGETPSYNPYTSPYERNPQAGEYSRQPGYAARAAWSTNVFGQPATVGAGGYYSRQNWGFGREINAWAGTIDWSVPFGKAFSWTGEFYRGQGLGGLGGGLYRSVLFTGTPVVAASDAQGLDTVGGWSQLKYKPRTKLEFNVAAGEDNPFAGEVRSYPYDLNFRYARLVRNQSGLVNVIFRPRSNLLFSAEYRHIQTYQLDGARDTADHVNLAMGILF